jgi:hypothetical protein
MSTIKNPKEKKRLSLKRDCRNVYGENPAASRKGVAKGKQRQHMNERRTVTQTLAQLNGPVEDDFASDVELKAKVAVEVSRKYGFKKSPDLPLGEFLERRKKRKQSAALRKAGANKQP